MDGSQEVIATCQDSGQWGEVTQQCVGKFHDVGKL